MTHIQLSVVIPAYNSNDSLEELARRLESILTKMTARQYEIIIVDDASPDPSTWERIQKIAAEQANVRAIQLMRNFGKAGAVLCGMSEARGDWIVTMDDDLQHRPEDLPALFEKREHDVVMGNFPVRKAGFVAELGGDVKAWLDHKLIGKPKHIRVSPLKLYRAQVVAAMLQIHTPYPFIAALLFEVTHDVVMVDVVHERRKYGRPAFTFRKRVRQFLNLLISNSSLLLRMAAVLGMVIAVLSVIAGAVLVILKFTKEAVYPGWTSLMVVTLVIGGVNLFTLGVVGEYLIRIIRGVESRPAYLVRQNIEPGGD